MALKPDRQIFVDTIEYYGNSVMERGGVVSQVAAGSSGVVGAAMDNSLRVVAYATTSSGVSPIGMLMWDFVNIDLSRQQVNRYKSEAQIGTKAFIMRKGTAVTNFWLPQALPSGGAVVYPATVYVGNSGLLGVGAGLANSGFSVVGKVLTGLDSDGYAEVSIDL